MSETNSPIRDCGEKPWRQLNRLRALPPDQVAVLIGNGRSTIASSENPVSHWDILLRRYNYFAIISKARHQVKETVLMQSSDVRFKFEVTIDLDARVHDPLQFLTEFSDKGQLIEPVIKELRIGLQPLLSRYSPSELSDAQNATRSFSASVSTEKHYAGCVTVHSLLLDIGFSVEGLALLRAMTTQQMIDEYGSRILLIMAKECPEESEEYMRLYNEEKSRVHEERHADREDMEWRANFIRQTFSDDPKTTRELLKDPTMLAAIRPPRRSEQRQEYLENASVTKKLLPSSSEPKRALPRPTSNDKQD